MIGHPARGSHHHNAGYRDELNTISVWFSLLMRISIILIIFNIHWNGVFRSTLYGEPGEVSIGNGECRHEEAVGEVWLQQDGGEQAVAGDRDDDQDDDHDHDDQDGDVRMRTWGQGCRSGREGGRQSEARMQGRQGGEGGGGCGTRETFLKAMIRIMLNWFATNIVEKLKADQAEHKKMECMRILYRPMKSPMLYNKKQQVGTK